MLLHIDNGLTAIYKHPVQQEFCICMVCKNLDLEEKVVASFFRTTYQVGTCKICAGLMPTFNCINRFLHHRLEHRSINFEHGMIADSNTLERI